MPKKAILRRKKALMIEKNVPREREQWPEREERKKAKKERENDGQRKRGRFGRGERNMHP